MRSSMWISDSADAVPGPISMDRNDSLRAEFIATECGMWPKFAFGLSHIKDLYVSIMDCCSEWPRCIRVLNRENYLPTLTIESRCRHRRMSTLFGVSRPRVCGLHLFHLCRPHWCVPFISGDKTVRYTGWSLGVRPWCSRAGSSPLQLASLGMHLPRRRTYPVA